MLPSIEGWKQIAWNTIAIFLGVGLALVVSDRLTDRGVVQPSGREGLYGVFLTNGQVYFGKVTAEQTDRIVLEQVFYAKMRREAVVDPSQQEDFQLVKLGNELHTPMDRIEIFKNQLLFLEQLREDGKVAEAIKKYQAP